VTGPANGSDAPPGSYLLFVTGSPDGSDVPSIARWVTVGSAPAADSCDGIAPATVSNLSASPCYGGFDSQYLLQWTAPADDGSLAVSRRAASYDIRQYGAAITDANWSLADPIGAPVPGDPGSTESSVVTIYSRVYVRMKTKDDQGNWSGLSNQVVLNTVVCDGGGMFAGGGGGGGDGITAQRGAGPTSAQASASSYGEAAENSVLNGVPPGTKGRDYLRLGALNVGSDGTCAVRVREAQDRAAALDAAKLLTVDHSAEVAAYAVGGAFMLGTRENAARITAPDGTDVTSTLNGSGTYSIGSGDTLSVDLGQGGGVSPLIIAAYGWGALECQVPDGSGGWRSAQSCYPRNAPDDLAFLAPGADVVRLVSQGGATLSFVGRLVVGQESPAVESAALVSSTDARAGDVSALVSASDTTTATLVGPDTLTLIYAVNPPKQGSTRDYFLVVDATPLDPKKPMTTQLQWRQALLPARFALRQNQPNPFSSATSIRFDLPVGAIVRLEVFDAQGRRLASLANHYFPPGFHAVSWTPSASAAKLGPGIYFYRIDAGAFHARNRMVLLP
jgi:hypothetical protein